jgi:hypothetical protein
VYIFSARALASCRWRPLSSNVRPQVSKTEANARLCPHVQALHRFLRLANISRWPVLRPSLTRSGGVRRHSKPGNVAALRQH